MSLVYCVVECRAAQSRWCETERQRQQLKKNTSQNTESTNQTQASATEMHPVGLKKMTVMGE